MKYLNKVLVVIAIFSIFMLTGCDDTSSYSVVTCNRNATTPYDNTTANLNYQIYYDGDYVKKTVSVESVTSSDKSVLKIYKDAYESIFAKYSDIDYYDNVVKMSNNKVTSTTTIDYTKVDIDKIVALEGEKGDIFTKNKKLKLETLLKVYKKNGSECNYS